MKSSFVPVVLVGLGSTGFLALAGHQDMLRVPGDRLAAVGMISYAGDDAAAVGFPLAGALSLVALACWGVVLVSRGRVRQAVALIAALAAAGAFAVVVVGGFLQNDDAAADIADQLGLPGLVDQLPLESTPWFWVALVASAVATAAAFTAVLQAPTWPEMGTRYDAPTVKDSTKSDVPPEERTSLDLWKSMDEGHDPTDDTP